MAISTDLHISDKILYVFVHIMFPTQDVHFTRRELQQKRVDQRDPTQKYISRNMTTVLPPSCANINFLLKQPLACESKFAQS